MTHHLPAAPLLDAVEKAAKRMSGVTYAGTDHTTHQERPIAPLLDRYQEVTGKTERTGNRRLKLLRTARSVPYYVADELCLTIGVHPAVVFGSLW